jgi:hypothetical protein
MTASMMRLTVKVGLILLPILTASCTRQGESKPNAAQARGIYATPADVFEAYKEAEWKREWRKSFDCFTPEAQKNMMFELAFQVGLSALDGSQKASLKKFFDGKREPDFEQEFQEKFGMDHATFREKMRGDPNLAAMEAAEQQLVRDVMAAHVRDKAGYFEAVRNLLDLSNDRGFVGELKQVTVEGDTASGQADSIYQSLSNEVSDEGKRVQKRVRTRFDNTLRFRKVNGGWLIEM